MNSTRLQSGPNSRDQQVDGTAEARSPPGQWRILTVALLCWAVTCWAILEPGRGTLVAIGGGLLGTVMLIWAGFAGVPASRRTARPSRVAVAFLLFCSCGFLLVGTQVHLTEAARSDALFSKAASSGKQVSFDAVLAGFPEVKTSPFGDRAWVMIEALRPTGAVPMLLWLPDAQEIPTHWGPGLRIEMTAKLKAEPPQSSTAYTANLKVLKEVEGAQLIDRISSRIGATAALLRQNLVQNAREVPGAELVPGFAVGDTSLVSERLSNSMLESSLTHLTAVSGSNTGLVIAAVVWCVARLRAGRKLRTVSAACGLVAFVLVVGPDASVQRAAVMASVLLIGLFGGRRSAALPALGVAVITLLALDPWQSLQPGFALSVAATCGILLCTTPLTKWLRTRVRLPKILALPIAVALAAQLFCGPLVLLLQPGVPAIGVLANVVAAPAAPLGTGIGLVATVLGPISPSLAVAAVNVASLAARWVAASAEVCAELPGGRWHWPEGWPGALLLAGCQLAILLAWALMSGRIDLPGVEKVKPRSPWQTKTPVPMPIRSTSAVLISVSLGIFLTSTVLTPYASQLSTPRNWAIVACNVGQGDALFVRDPKRPDEIMLIDTGDNPELLNSCMSQFGVNRISLLVLTHDDRDHVGALESVLGRVDSALISPTLFGETIEQRGVVQTLHESAVPYQIGAAGDGRSSEGSGLAWQVIAPQPTTVPAESNAASLVLLIEISGHRLLALADTGYEEQYRLRAAATLADINVVKIAHHGSRDQDVSLIDRLNADWGLVSVGADNSYGHPNAETLAAFARAGTRTLRTDEHGSVALVLEADGTLAPWVERTTEPNTPAGPKASGDD